MNRLSRRDFVGLCALTGVAGCARFPSGTDATPIAFNTANLVARVTGYRYESKNWGEQHKKTVTATDAPAWRSICEEIARAGFRAVEVWEAHASPEPLQGRRAGEWRRILQDNGLRPVAYAGHLGPETIDICEHLEIPHIDGGLGKLSPDEATGLCRSSGIQFNIENHPEKSAKELLDKIGGGNDWLGVCVDTGWFATQGVDAAQMIRELGSLVRHSHIKDVKRAGAHESCLLGEGVANVAAAIEALKSVRYAGAYSWEDEPEDRNPFDSAKQNLEWIKSKLQ